MGQILRGKSNGSPGLFGGMRRGGDLPDPGIVLPSHEKPADKLEKPSKETEKSEKPK